MSKHTAIIHWKQCGTDFLKGQYSREHTWSFDGGLTLAASASPEIVPLPWSNAAGLDPEEALVASISSCHMLWFLSMASKAGFAVAGYRDEAVGQMTKNEQGKSWISSVTLHPKIEWDSLQQPDSAEIAHLHHLAHEECFIANSLKTKIHIVAIS
jgi:organic hydroperoxide reductase OsmC/OhrA